MPKKQQNKLAPETKGDSIKNFFLNILIAIAGLLKWTWRILSRPFRRKDE